MKRDKPFFIKCGQGVQNLYNGKYGKSRKITKAKIEEYHFISGNALKYDTEGFYFIEKAQKRGWLFVKGTDKIPDWISNFHMSKMSIPYVGVNKKIKTHTGFTDGYKLIRSFVMEVFKDCNEIVFVGHSRGAAIAALAAVDMEYNYNIDREKITVILDGCPWFGNKHFMKSYQKRIPHTYCFRKGLDIVSFIPFFGYKYFNRIFKIGKSAWPFWNTRDHYPQGYLKAKHNYNFG